MATGKSVRDIVLENRYLTEMEANIILDLHKMTTPGHQRRRIAYFAKKNKGGII